MADLNSIIRIIFSGEDQLSGVARGAANQISALGDAATAIASPFADLANNILLVDTAIAGIALVIGTKAVQASSALGTSLSDLNKFLSEGEGDASQYRQQFENLSITYGANVNEIIQSTADWRAANFDVNQSLALTRNALDFSIAGQISAAEATDLLKKIVSGLSIEQDKAVAASQRFGDVINYVADQSQGDFQQLAIAVAGVAPTINQTGASFEQIVGILASVNDVTQSGSKTFSAFNVIVSQLSKPTKDAELALKDFGITTNAAGINQSTFYETLSKIAAKWPELTDRQKAAYAQSLVSAEQVAEFSAIMNNWGKSTEYATGAVKNATNSMAGEVTRSLATSEAAFKSFGAAVDVAFAGIGGKIEPGVVQVTNALKGFVLEFGNLAKLDNSALQPLFDLFNRASGELAKIIDAISLNLDDALAQVDFGGLTNALSDLFGELDDLFTAFFGDIDLTTVEGLAAGLQKVVDVGEFLARTTQGIVAAFESFADAAGRAVDEFIRLDSASQLDFGQFIGSAKLLIDAGIGIGSALIAIGKAGLDMKEVMDLVFGGIRVAINTVQIAIDGLVLIAVGSATKIAEAMRSAFSLFGDDQAVADIDKALAGLNKIFNETTKSIEANKAELAGGWKQAIGEAGNETEAARQKLEKSADAFKTIGVNSEQGAEGAKTLAQELQKLADIKLEKLEVGAVFPSAEAAETAGQLKRIGDETTQLVPKLVTVRDENGKVIQTYTELTNVVPGVTGTFSVIGNALDSTKEKAKDAAKESDNFRIKMEEIASNERIKTIEASVNLNIAALEADVERVKATFASIDTTIKSTGDLVGDLFGSLIGTDDPFKELAIKAQIDTENKRRQEALDIQKKLAEAEIERINAQTRALDAGDAILTIQADGLEPHLEAFMWEILKKIRARVNAEFSEFLLGTV